MLAAALAAVTDFGDNPGALDMFEYVPAGLPAGRPVVVVMHGCTQTAAAMEAAGWDALADTYGFAVVYPQQRSANQQLECFSWYAPEDTARGGGEAASIVAMVDAELARHGGARDRVYVTGMSAGGAFVTVMLAAYPDRFRAGSVMSGLVYGCAKDVASASSCQQMTSSAQRSAMAWGDAVRAADPGFAGPWPRVQIWQGASDYTVAPANATELVKQWTDVRGASAEAEATDTVTTATRTRYAGGAVELYLVSGMGHAIAIGTDPDGTCPATSGGAFFTDEKICSTLRAAEFFGLTGSGMDPGGGGDAGNGDAGAPSPGGFGCDATVTQSPWLAIACVVLVRRRRSLNRSRGRA